MTRKSKLSIRIPRTHVKFYHIIFKYLNLTYHLTLKNLSNILKLTISPICATIYHNLTITISHNIFCDLFWRFQSFTVESLALMHICTTCSIVNFFLIRRMLFCMRRLKSFALIDLFLSYRNGLMSAHKCRTRFFKPYLYVVCHSRCNLVE